MSACEPQINTCQIFARCSPSQKQIIALPWPPLLKKVIDEAEIPRLENARDVDNALFKVEAHLHLAPVTLGG